MWIGDWGLGIGPNPQSPIPNPQSPIPNPQLMKYEIIKKLIFIIKNKNYLLFLKKINYLYYFIKNNYLYTK